MDINELVSLIGQLKGDNLKKAQKALKVNPESESLTQLAGEDDADFQKRLDAKQRELKIDAEKLKIIMSQNEALGEQRALQENATKLLEQYEEIMASSIKTIEGMNEKQAKAAALAELGISKEQFKDLEELKKKYEELGEAGVAAYDEMAPRFKDLATSIGFLSPQANKALGGMKKLSDIMTDTEKRKGAMKAFREAFNFKNFALSIASKAIEQTIKYAFAVDNASASLAKATGAGQVFRDEIKAVGGQFRNLGLGAEDAAKSVGSLFNNFTGFTSASKKDRKELIKTVASLEKLGVSSDTAAKNLQLLQTNFGMSTKQASKLTKQLAIAGTKIGISAQKMMEGFVAASKSLAVYGKDAIKVFTDLAAQAKAAGVETATLLGLAEKFDTFSGAADAVGKLNSILGTNLSAIDMLNMKENERIETLIRSIQAQGIAFKDLGRFEQKAIAAAAGISDLSEAQRIFGMSVNDYRKGLREAASEEEFNKRLKDAMSVMQKFEKIMQNFAIQIAPLVEILAFLAEGFLDISQAMGGLPAMLALVAAGFYFIPVLFPIISGFFTATLGGLAGLTAGLPALGASLATMGAAVQPFAVGLGLVVAVLAALAAAFYAVTLAGQAFYKVLYGDQDKELAINKSKIDLAREQSKVIEAARAASPQVENITANIALAATGKAAGSLTATGTTQINNLVANIEKSFSPNIQISIEGDEVKKLMQGEVVKLAAE